MQQDPQRHVFYSQTCEDFYYDGFANFLSGNAERAKHDFRAVTAVRPVLLAVEIEIRKKTAFTAPNQINDTTLKRQFYFFIQQLSPEFLLNDW